MNKRPRRICLRCDKPFPKVEEYRLCLICRSGINNGDIMVKQEWPGFYSEEAQGCRRVGKVGGTS